MYAYQPPNFCVPTASATDTEVTSFIPEAPSTKIPGENDEQDTRLYLCQIVAPPGRGGSSPSSAAAGSWLARRKPTGPEETTEVGVL